MIKFRIDDVLTATGNTTDKGWEKKVKEWAKGVFYNSEIIRWDNKDGNPDWLVLHEGNAVGVECKRYLTCGNIEVALSKWRKGQKEQYDNFTKLLNNVRIFVIFALKDATWLVELENE